MTGSVGPADPSSIEPTQRTEVIGPILAEEGRQVHLGFWIKG